jgi:hypothetical protein
MRETQNVQGVAPETDLYRGAAPARGVRGIGRSIPLLVLLSATRNTPLSKSISFQRRVRIADLGYGDGNYLQSEPDVLRLEINSGPLADISALGGGRALGGTMRADHVEVSWDADKSNWLVRIKSGEEVIRRHCKLPKDADEKSLRAVTQQVVQDEGYELDVAELLIRR